MAAPVDPETGKAHIRLFVDQPLCAGGAVDLQAEPTHYLRNVMRRKVGDSLAVFNGADGEWSATIAALDRKSARLSLGACIRPQSRNPDIWLVFAPVKGARMDFIAQKATELGAGVLVPVLTHRTVVRKVNVPRLRANAVEAAEQCNCLVVPPVHEAVTLDRLLDDWDPARTLIHCDESGAAPPIQEALPGAPEGPAAILIGPEGGFDRAERDRLRRLPSALAVGLGPRIMRADTAALAALALWQAIRGDWR
jgi:16S rRNA (uracil1498-N3)-methyltransferase